MKERQAEFEPYTQTPQEIKEPLRYPQTPKLFHTQYIIPLFYININVMCNLRMKSTLIKEECTLQ